MTHKPLLPALAVLIASSTTAPAIAQVINTDTVFPGGAANKLDQRYKTINPEVEEPKFKLKGRVINGSGEYYVIPDQPSIIRLKKAHRKDDTIYGKTLQIGPGLGGAILY